MLEPRKPVLAGAVIAALLSLPIGGAAAQQTTAPAAAPAGAVVTPPQPKPVPPLRLQERPLAEVTAELTRVTGILVAADSSVAQVPVTLETNGGPLPGVLAGVLKQLPKGTTLRYVALPGYKPMPQGDAIARFLTAEEGLRPNANGESTAVKGERVVGGEEIEILGQRLSAERAAPVMASLNLRPVYVLANPTSEDPVARSGKLQTEGLQLWMDMTSDQRRQAAENQLNGILSMDSNTRRALFGQMRDQASGMMKKIQSLPPDQRAEFFRDLTGGRWDGTTPPPANNPAGGGGNQ